MKFPPINRKSPDKKSNYIRPNNLLLHSEEYEHLPKLDPDIPRALKQLEPDNPEKECKRRRKTIKEESRRISHKLPEEGYPEIGVLLKRDHYFNK